MTLRTLASFALFSSTLAAQSVPTISLRPVASGFERPVQLVDAHDGRSELYVAEQKGVVHVVMAGVVLDRPFLDISHLVSCCNNGGILSIVFHPQYATNGRFFVQYADSLEDTAIAEFRRSAHNLLLADPTYHRVLLTVDQPLDNVPNHHGGTLLFGRDGLLYSTIGDGGAYVRVTNRAQELHHLLGKIIRIDVDRGDPYAIPSDNPFVGVEGVRPEVWAYGLRNPWRFSFDRETDLMFVADVGQDTWEEVNANVLSQTRGANFGWPLTEGKHCYPIGSSCDMNGLLLPELEHTREFGCSITGGFRYRGTRWNRFRGAYLYGDFCSGQIWGATQQTDGSWSARELLDSETQIVSFGEDDNGEVYVVDYEGTIYTVTDAPLARRRGARR